MSHSRSDAEFEADHKVATEVHLDGLGPHLLPRCTVLQGAYWSDQTTLVVRLETEKGQLVLVPFDLKTHPDLTSIFSNATSWPSSRAKPS
jgi:hypothetical protein